MARQHKAAVWLPAVLLLVAMLLQAAGPAQAVLPDSSRDSESPATSAAAAAAAKQRKPSLPNNHLWIVQLKDAPAVAYSGDLPGLAATMAQPPESAAASVGSDQASTSSSSSSSSDAIDRRPRFTATSSAAVQYASYIAAQSEAAVARALGPSSSAKIRHRYSTVLAGFTVGPLSSSEAHALRKDPNVASVTRDGRGHIKTISTPAFLGLSSPNGAWSKVGGWSKAGEGIIIGMVDTGYWPEGPAFSDLEFPNNSSGRLAFGPPPDKFSGICMAGDDFPASTCNNKVIGCRYFLDGVGGQQRVKELWPTESISCRATDGGSVTHGSHTGSTAAGNYGIVSDNPSYQGSMSGMAPAARLAIYKASWGSDDGGYASDFVAAIEQATKDGVDVINYSMGAAAELSFSTPVETAFRHAAAAGVFVSAACGNTGPGPYTIVDTWGPWIMSVGASTFSRSYTARSAAAAAAATTQASAAADSNDAAAAAAASKDGVLPQQETSPTMPYFTSRGPIVAGDGNLLKPDITAPGVSVVAQVPNYNGYTSRSMSGTSMSAPHISGIAAVVMSKHPTWSPMAVKSAIMTTAYQTTRTGPPPSQKQAFGGPFDFGAGHVDATLALDPGLIIDSGAPDWQRFMCGISEVPYNTWDQHAECRPCQVALADAACAPSKYESMTAAQVSRCVACDPSNFNTPSIAMSMLAGPKYVTRTLTNVKPTSATYTAVIDAPEGFIVTLSPQSFTAAAGASTTVRIRFQKSSRNTPYSVWQAGAITWVGSGGTRTRIPLVVRAVQLASRPTEVKLKAWQGSYSYLVEPEWNGVLATANTGLQPSEVYSGTVEVSEYSHRLQVVLPPGVWSYVRFATFNDDVSGWNGVLPDFSSINLQVFKPDGSSAGVSANDYNSDEQVNLENAPGGTYTVQITADTEEAISFKVHVWALNFTAAAASTATLTSSPSVAALAKAASGAPLQVDLTFARLLADGSSAGQRYLGAVVYSGQPGGVYRRLRSVKTLVSLV